MSEETSMLEEVITRLKQQRDELALQIHLGKEEAKEEWNKLEQKLQSLSDEFEPVKDVLDDTATNVVTGLALVAGELKEGFDRLRKLL